MPLAVVTEVRGLHDAGQPHLADGRRHITSRFNFRKRNRGKTVSLQPILFPGAILTGFQNLPVRPQKHHLLDLPERFYRDILKFIGDRRTTPGEFLQPLDVLVREIELPGGDFPRRTIFLGLVDMQAVSQSSRRVGEHATKLAAAKNA